MFYKSFVRNVFFATKALYIRLFFFFHLLIIYSLFFSFTYYICRILILNDISHNLARKENILTYTELPTFDSHGALSIRILT